MIKGLTTIIVIGHHETHLSVQMTKTCLGNITKYTDPKDYELIVIEDIPVHKVEDDFHVFKIKEWIELKERTNYSTKINIAAKKARGEYLAIIQNDCFVSPDWLEGLRYYFDNGLAEAMIPEQFAVSYEYMQAANQMTYEEALDGGQRDACMIMITKDAFERTGGFNEDLDIFQEADFYERMAMKEIDQHTTSKVHVTHIGLGTHYQNMDDFEKATYRDSQIRNHGVNPKALV